MFVVVVEYVVWIACLLVVLLCVDMMANLVGGVALVVLLADPVVLVVPLLVHVIVASVAFLVVLADFDFVSLLA